MFKQNLHKQGEISITHSYAYMTLQGTISKSLQGLAFSVLGASLAYCITSLLPKNSVEEQAYLFNLLSIGGVLIPSMLALGCFFVHISSSWSKYVLFPYAFFKGIMLFSVTYLIERSLGIPGIGLQTLLGSGSVVLCVAIMYTQEWIRATSTFTRRVLAITTAILLLLLVDLVLVLFNIANPFAQVTRGNGWLGIGFSILMIVLSACFLLIKMTCIHRAAFLDLPKHMESYYAFSLLLSLFSMYLRILDLLRKINSRR